MIRFAIGVVLIVTGFGAVPTTHENIGLIILGVVVIGGSTVVRELRRGITR